MTRGDFEKLISLIPGDPFDVLRCLHLPGEHVSGRGKTHCSHIKSGCDGPFYAKMAYSKQTWPPAGWLVNPVLTACREREACKLQTASRGHGGQDFHTTFT
jgi:hypothetical protein